MKQRQATIFSLLFSVISAGSFLVILSLLSLAYPLGNLEQTYIAVLRLDGILFVFTLTISAFLLDKMKPIEQSLGYVFFIGIFFSLLISIGAAFIGLLWTDSFPPQLIIVSISFALGAILKIIWWLQDIAFPHQK